MKIMKGTIHQIKNLKEVNAPAYIETKKRYRDMIRKRFGFASDLEESPEADFLRDVMGIEKWKKFTDIIGVKPESKTLDEASDWWKKFAERWVILRANYKTFKPSQRKVERKLISNLLTLVIKTEQMQKVIIKI